ncbi:MAG: acyl-CoA dehydrogenase [Alphaproteobacteria bacterium]|nr:acyl-CoA dehydrogenase [Beijerinckiaceae bacterium]NBQ40335.1 acyl-CoA dehydrogenase [Alphaproteobacteria bacterium]
MTYRAPVAEIAFMAKTFGLDSLLKDGLAPELADDLADAVLEEAGKFATDRIATLNQIGDQIGNRFEDGVVTTAPGWKETYRDWAEGGWNGLTAPSEHGGQALPQLLQTACSEMWTSASMAFMLGPMLTTGAVDALVAHGSDELKKIYLDRLVSGEWMGTMNLTEPHAGSDVGALKTRAERSSDGSYRISGQKIYITYGEHDLTDNIIHLVLARLPDAPQGTRGISLFLVPKFLVNPDGTLGARNDVRCAGLEHKLGIHASPTCTMIYGDQGGAIGYLIGEENRGLNCMFTMMNSARLGVGLQGVAIAERAYQLALTYASERKQGRALGSTADGMSAIIAHPDVRRMLMLMRSRTDAARAICYMTAAAMDRSHRETDPEKRKASEERAALLTPIAKAWSTDIGIEVASLGIQVHGGMGFIEGSGAAQHLRDARIAAIYEGTNGIQAIDLVTRKLPLSNGDAVRSLFGEMHATLKALKASNLPGFGSSADKLSEAMAALKAATLWMAKALKERTEEALASATPYQTLFGTTLGGINLVRAALADPSDKHIATARFFAEQIAPEVQSLSRTVTEGATALSNIDSVLLASA